MALGVGDGALSSKTYRLIPSGSSTSEARDIGMEVRAGDVPLFVAERLAFAGDDGPQVSTHMNMNIILSSDLS